jgi:chemotaxis protein methyltransferase CheR
MGARTAPRAQPHAIQVDDASFARLAALVQNECGIVLSESKRNLVISRLGRRVRDLGLPDFEAYCHLIETRDGHEERRRMTSLLTTNVTKFFREPHHFERLRTGTLPPLLARAREGGRVRLWSAGCSSGQEAYSLAITLLELCPEATSLDIKILATDIDPVMIEKGRAAIYDDVSDDVMPPALRRKYFQPHARGEDHWQVTDPARALVRFAELNLMQDWPFQGRFDVIFCRNVVIYFDPPTQHRLWSRFAEALSPGGGLFVGHSERVAGSAGSAFAPDGITQYRKS